MRPTPSLIDAATRLLRRAGGSADDAASVPGAAAKTLAELTVSIAAFVGTAGARALFARTIVLAQREHGWLGPVVAARGEDPWPALRAALDGRRDVAWSVSHALVADYLALVVTFVGEALTLQIVRQSFPDAFAPPEEKP